MLPPLLVSSSPKQREWDVRRVAGEDNAEMTALDADHGSLGVGDRAVRVDALLDGPWVRVLWGLAVVDAENGLARADGPSAQTLLVTLGAHGDEAAAREVHDELGGSRQLFLGAVEEQHGLDGGVIGTRGRGRAADVDIANDRDLGHVQPHETAQLPSATHGPSYSRRG